MLNFKLNNNFFKIILKMVFNLVNMIKKTFIIRMFFFNFLLKFKNKWVLFIQRLDDGMLRFKKKN